MRKSEKQEKQQEEQREAERRKAIKKYKKKLSAITKNIEEEKKIVASILIDRLSYLAAYLDELQESTIKSGVVVAYDNGGGQSGYRISPEVNVYTAYAKQLTATVKQLQGFMPETQADHDALAEFAKKFK